ncbi:MAG: DUF4129 domain-containing protein [Candidatus Acidiferrum sp.]
MKRWGVGSEMRSRVLVLAVLIAFWLPCGAQTPAGDDASPAAPSEFDLQSYQRELSHIEEASKNPQKIPELRRSLPEVWTVRDGGYTYSVPTEEISDALRQIEHDPKRGAAGQLETRLKAMCQQAEQLAKSPFRTNSAEAELKLKKILDRGEFQAASGPSAWDLMRARINRWIFEHLLKLLRLLHISQKTGNAIAWGIIFLAVVLVFYSLYRWLRKSAKEMSFRAEVEPTASDARHWAQEALTAADRGDFREAIHSAYWASVAHLEDIHLLPRDRARTPRESLRLLDRHPKEQGLLQTLTRSFELIWYGYRPVSAAEWAGTKEQLEKMGCLQASIAPTVPS